MNPGALPVDLAARLLSKVGRRLISPEMLHADIDAGAPTNPDGTLNLVDYSAWNIQQLSARSDGD